MNIFQNLSSIPGSNILETIYVIARALITAADLLLLIGVIYAIKKGLKFRPKFDLDRQPKKKLHNLRNAYFKDKWTKLMERYTTEPNPDSIRLAIIEADALVDHLLKDLRFPGEHLADRLSYLNSGDIKTLDGVWDSHRIRNEIVHRPNSPVSIRDGMAALKRYEAFFHELAIF